MNSNYISSIVLLLAIINWAQAVQNENLEFKGVDKLRSHIRHTMGETPVEPKSRMKQSEANLKRPTKRSSKLDVDSVGDAFWRTRRDTETRDLFDADSAGGFNQNQLDAPQVYPDRQPRPRTDPQELANYNATISEHESRLHSLIKQISNSPYMPSRDQVIQLTTTLITLALMILLGPAIGAQAGVIQAILRQIVPLVVAFLVHYTADRTVPMKLVPNELPQGDIVPVQAQHSMATQAF